jgi:ADP-ribosylglycohydrolase/protein-tyrosine phosphatase
MTGRDSDSQLDLLGNLLGGPPKPAKTETQAAQEKVADPRRVESAEPAKAARAIEVASSEAFPLELHPVPGVEGLFTALAPGQVGVSDVGVRHARSLESDLERMAGTTIVDLTTPAEQGALGLAGWHERARTREHTVVACPVAPDAALEPATLARLVTDVRARLANGERVVIVSRRGLARAGMVAAAVMVAGGRAADEAIAALRESRGRGACETDAQVEAVRSAGAESTGAGEGAVERRGRSEAEDELDDESESVSEGEDERDGETDHESDDEDELDDDESLFAGRHAASDANAAWPVVASARATRTPRTSMDLGCVLGGAIGDAMGHPTEFLSMGEIRRRWGASGVTGFELWWDRGGARFAPYTDDTQMAEAVLISLLASREQNEDLDAAMRRMGAAFVEWSRAPQGGHRAPGNACMSGARALARGVPWNEAGGATAGGCGSVMRAYPFGLVFSNDLAQAERWSVAHSQLTHRDPIALAASAAMAVGVARIVRGERTRDVLSEMVAAACRYSARTAQMMSQALDEAWSGVGPEVTLDRNRGWAAHEAIAAAVYVVARHPDDARAAILEGANTPGDSDSIATLAGALVGARVGIEGLPAEWVRDVERTSELTALAERIAPV